MRDKNISFASMVGLLLALSGVAQSRLTGNEWEDSSLRRRDAEKIEALNYLLSREADMFDEYEGYDSLSNLMARYEDIIGDFGEWKGTRRSIEFLAPRYLNDYESFLHARETGDTAAATGSQLSSPRLSSSRPNSSRPKSPVSNKLEYSSGSQTLESYNDHVTHVVNPKPAN